MTKKFRKEVYGLSGKDRTDLELRTTLRSIRKHFLNDFKSTSMYHKTKHRSTALFEAAIKEYCVKLISKNEGMLNYESELIAPFQQELFFFLGTLIYHKHISVLVKDEVAV